eukprot:3773638-Pleurochrysis_carterae.AAC.2
MELAPDEHVDVAHGAREKVHNNGNRTAWHAQKEREAVHSRRKERVYSRPKETSTGVGKDRSQASERVVHRRRKGSFTGVGKGRSSASERIVHRRLKVVY